MEVWRAGEPAVRVYRRDRGPRGFNRTRSLARFRPIHAVGGAVVPTAYGAADRETALAEALLRGVDALVESRWRRLYVKEVAGLEMVTLSPTVDLELARLRGQGLTRLGLLRADVIDCEADRYPYTAEWAQALYECSRKLAGIAWTSRQNDSARALVLWGGRIDPRADLRVIDSPVALDREPGIDLVRQACSYASFDFEG